MFEFKKDVSLKDFCTFHIGGKAKFLFIANTTENLINACIYANLHNIKYKIIGLGANLLFDDKGFNGLIIVNKTNEILFKQLREKERSISNASKNTPSLSLLIPNGNHNNETNNHGNKIHDNIYNLNNKSHNHFVHVDGGVNVTNLIMKCCLRSLCGIESLAGIPSTVGGAVVNSLGAFDTNFSDYVEYVECYHKNDLTKKLKLSHEECKFGYRSSLFKNDEYIITRVKLKLHEDNQSMIRKRITEAIEKKKSTQPLDQYSAGSVFKRSDIIPAKVIDDLGLKGTKIGGAEISMKHAGFIINTNSATSKDVKDLIKLIQKEVKSATNEDLEPEIEFVEY